MGELVGMEGRLGAPWVVAVVPGVPGDGAVAAAAADLHRALARLGIPALLAGGAGDPRLAEAGAPAPWRMAVWADGAEVVGPGPGQQPVRVPLDRAVGHLVRQLAVIRPYTAADIPALIRLQEACFPPPYPQEQLWTREQLLSHIARFPEGALCAEVCGQIVASGTTLIVRLDPDHLQHTWSEITGDGYLTPHNPQGDTLYGVDLCVHPDWRGFGIARLIYAARFDLVRRLGLRRFCAAGRMPGYHRYADRMTPEEYVAKVVAGELTDPTLTPQLRSGLRPVAVLHGYIPDAESRDCALLMEWRNPDIP